MLDLWDGRLASLRRTALGVKKEKKRYISQHNAQSISPCPISHKHTLTLKMYTRVQPFLLLTLYYYQIYMFMFLCPFRIGWMRFFEVSSWLGGPVPLLPVSAVQQKKKVFITLTTKRKQGMLLTCMIFSICFSMHLFALLLELQVLIHQPANLFLQILHICLHTNKSLGKNNRATINTQTFHFQVNARLIVLVEMLVFIDLVLIKLYCYTCPFNNYLCLETAQTT